MCFPLLLSSLLLLLPLPPVGATPAKPCVEADCKLPNCRCASTDIPGGLPPNQTPQIVTISFDDGLRVEDYERYYSQFLNGRKNPNGCPIPLTFFITHNYTDYALTEDLFSAGHEAADHSVTHREEPWWLNASVADLTAEIVDMQTILLAWANIARSNVIGYRAPYLATSENEIKALYDSNFTYECSMTTPTMYWPFTLDYKSPICTSPATCPVNSYPGLWILPNIQYKQKNGPVCPMLDACTKPTTEQEWLDFLLDNFFAHYHGNRAPFGLYAHSAWFYLFNQGRLQALEAFLDKIQSMPDVYIVTQSQMLAWVRSPTPLSKVKDFPPWQCAPRPPPRCSYKNEKTCTFSGTEILHSCVQTCPRCWPNIGDPYGKCTV